MARKTARKEYKVRKQYLQNKVYIIQLNFRCGLIPTLSGKPVKRGHNNTLLYTACSPTLIY